MSFTNLPGLAIRIHKKDYIRKMAETVSFHDF